MRNLKRALSLTLASVMLLGMMVVGSSAASYPDVSDEDNVEAIEVLQRVAVMEGDNNGNFNPDDYVTREQMAVIMSKLLNLDYNYYQGTNPFSDVPAWAAPYVAACAANGITSGIGGGMYGAGQNVNAVQAALMMLKALGYFQYQEDFGDSYILATVKQATEVGLFELIDSNAQQALTRNEVAQMALNALKSEMVTFTGDVGTKIPTANGDVVVGYKAEYTPRTSTESKYQAIERRTSDVAGGNNLNRGQYYVQLGEELYNGDLRLSDNSQDDFGRPARTWTYKSNEIGTYAKRELIVPNGIYNVEVKGREIYDLLGQTTIRDNAVESYLNGHETEILKSQLVRSNNSGLRDTSRANNPATTGRGVLTEVYLDTDLDRITIVSIDTYLAKATTDYNENSETITLNVYNGFSGTSKVVDLEDVPAIANLKKDDWVLVNWADESDAVQNKVVVKMMTPEIMEDVTVTSFSRDTEEYTGDAYNTTGQRVDEITADGTTYKNNRQAWYKQTTLYDYNADLMVNKTYTLYMDQYGNFIGAELYSGKDQYVFITGYDRPQSNISVSTAKAAAIFTDGTMAAIDVNVKDTNANIKAYNDKNYAAGYTETNCDYVRWGNELTSGTPADQMGHHANSEGNPYENMWYKYTVNNDVYTLSPVDHYTRDVNTLGGSQEKTINCTNVRLVSDGTYALNSAGNARAYGEDESIYITVDDDDVDYLPSQAITEVTGRYTGVQNVNLVYQQLQWVHSVNDEDGFIVAAIVYGEAEGIVDNYAYIIGGVKNEKLEDGVHYWDVDVVMNGEKTTKTIKSRFANTVQYLRPGYVQELVLDADGYVTKINDLYDQEPPTANPRDELYNNYDYNATTNTDVGILDDYEVYDITTTSGLNGTSAVTGTNRYMLDLAVQGHTLRWDRDGRDIGLDFVREAKAVVRQTINNETKWSQYTGENAVQTAFATLADADGDATTNTNGKKQFSGRVIAVLNAQGVAEWVFFYDYTPINSTDKNPGTPVITGDRVSQYRTLADVNELLKSRDVIINGTWLPNDLATNNVLVIPANRTLTILGDFNTLQNDGSHNIIIAADSKTTSKLVVGDATEAPDARLTLVQDVDFPVTAQNVTTRGANVTIKQPMTVVKELNVYSDKLTVNSNVSATTLTKPVGHTANVEVNGHLTVNGLEVDTQVLSDDSLIVRNYVASGVTVKVGDGSAAHNGYAEIKTLNATAKIEINNDGGKTSTVENAVNNAIIDVKKGSVAVTGTLDTPKVAVAANASLTIKSTAELGSNSKFVTQTTGDKVSDVKNDLVINPTVSPVGNVDGNTAITVPDASVVVASPSYGQPTSETDVRTTNSSMAALAPYVSLNLSETYTANAAYKSNEAGSATNYKGTIAVSGSLKKVLASDLPAAAYQAFANAETDTWAEFKALYNLGDDEEVAFIRVAVAPVSRICMLVKQGSSWSILVRDNDDGELHYYNSTNLVQAFGGKDQSGNFTAPYYAIDVKGLY